MEKIRYTKHCTENYRLCTRTPLKTKDRLGVCSINDSWVFAIIYDVKICTAVEVIVNFRSLEKWKRQLCNWQIKYHSYSLCVIEVVISRRKKVLYTLSALFVFVKQCLPISDWAENTSRNNNRLIKRHFTWIVWSNENVDI